MAELELKVTLKKGGGATGATMRVDRKAAKMVGASVGSVVVQTTDPETGAAIIDHTYTIWVYGSHLATLDYKVEQGTFTLNIEPDGCSRMCRPSLSVTFRGLRSAAGTPAGGGSEAHELGIG